MLKAPDATLDYSINLAPPGASPWLVTGESIASFIWTVPDGLTKVREETGATAATVWLSGGVLGVTYRVFGEWTTDATPTPRVDSRYLTIEIVQRPV